MPPEKVFDIRKDFYTLVKKKALVSTTFAPMQIKQAEFLCSNTQVSKLPEAKYSEYAFIGRSNVGKSSLINMLVQQKGLAKISSKPGKTQLINHFLINESWYLVDLPGYGYAKVSQTERQAWQKMIDSYLRQRENLQCVFVLIDSRIPPQKNDLDFCGNLGEIGVPFVLCFTKADKQSRVKTDQTIAKFRKELLVSFEEMPQLFITASITSMGRDNLLQFIEQVNQNYVPVE